MSNKEIARTTIELDADIITILSQDLVENANPTLLVALHNCNVKLVSNLFEYHMKKFCHFLLDLSKLIQWASFLPVIVSLIMYALPILSSLLGYNRLQPMDSVLHTSVVGISAIASSLLYKFLPKLLFRYMPRTLFRLAPIIIGYLIKGKILSDISL